jgi:peptidoglycan/LPS O-acetylase OafA/YrhL
MRSSFASTDRCGITFSAHGIVFGFAWSLTVEEQFYLLWPWLLRLRALLVPVLFMLALLLVRVAADHELLPVRDGGFAQRLVFNIAPPICLGSLLAIGMGTPRTSPILRAVLGARWSAPVAFASMVVAIVLCWPLLLVHLAMAALVGTCVARSDHGLRALTDARAVRHVGVVSYGIYLLHGPLVAIVLRRFEQPLPVFVIAFGLSIGVATLSYRFIEAPFLRLRERFRVVPL